MPGTLSQMQMLYSPEEDRVLFRLNTTDQKEYRFWLTRRFVQLLYRVLSEHIASDPDVSLQGTNEAKRAVMEFKREQVIERADFQQPFKEQPELPLGTDALLAYKITSNRQGDQLHLGIHPKDRQGISMVINRDINTTLLQLLVTAVKKAEWNLLPANAQPEAADDEAPSAAGSDRIIN